MISATGYSSFSACATNTACNGQSQTTQTTSVDARRDTPNPLKPNDKEAQVIQALKTRDREVHAHEAAHAAAAGGLAGGTSFTYEIGPDGKRYAVGGEVSIDVSVVPNNPEATLRKAETIRAAALAPRQPSSQDLAVAAQAAQMAIEARREMDQGKDESPEAPNAGARKQVENYQQIAAVETEPVDNLLNAFA